MSGQGLLGLPTELLLQISAHFSLSEYLAARATCRRLDAALLESYGRTFARTFQVMRTDFSLQGLVDMSKSRLSPFLKHVIVSMEEFPPGSEYHSGQDMGYWQSQRQLIASGADFSMLQEAFGATRLETVELHSYYCYDPEAPWTTYGASRILRDTGLDLSKTKPPDNVSQTLAQIVMDLLGALGRAGARPRRFMVSLAEGHLRDEAFVVPSQIKEAVVSVLSHLESVSLPLQIGGRPPGIIGLPIENPSDTTYNFRRFLRYLDTRNLQCLRLDCIGANVSESPEVQSLFQWLGSSPTASLAGQRLLNVGGSVSGRLRASPPPVRFEMLLSLDLGDICIAKETLVQVIKKFRPSLRTLRLRSVCLVGRTAGWEPQPRSGGEIWSSFFADLVSIGCGESLSRISSAKMYESPWQTARSLVVLYINGDTTTDFDCYDVVMRDALNNLAQAPKHFGKNMADLQ